MRGIGACAALALWLAGCSQNASDKSAEEALREKGLTPQSASRPATGLPPGHPPTGGPAGRSAAAPGGGALPGLTATVPEGWRSQAPTSSMRVAEYVLPGTASGAPDATLAVFYFGSAQGGSVEANIERWYGQFTQPGGGSTREKSRRWEETVQGMPVTLVDISGTFDGGGMGMGAPAGPQENYRMLGAIVAGPQGSVFCKLTGPAATVARWEESFAQYVRSMRPE
ncbi:MAG: hypothetical protein AB1505_33085 [Candidatus Latescibacterota bacterium]